MFSLPPWVPTQVSRLKENRSFIGCIFSVRWCMADLNVTHTPLNPTAACPETSPLSTCLLAGTFAAGAERGGTEYCFLVKVFVRSVDRSILSYGVHWHMSCPPTPNETPCTSKQYHETFDCRSILSTFWPPSPSLICVKHGRE